MIHVFISHFFSVGRLNRLLEENKVSLGSHPDGKPEDWFNVFILHQNRARADEADQEGKAVAEERIGESGPAPGQPP